jgi:hypothetical protein
MRAYEIHLAACQLHGRPLRWPSAHWGQVLGTDCESDPSCRSASGREASVPPTRDVQGSTTRSAIPEQRGAVSTEASTARRGRCARERKTIFPTTFRGIRDDVHAASTARYATQEFRRAGERKFHSEPAGGCEPRYLPLRAEESPAPLER